MNADPLPADSATPGPVPVTVVFRRSIWSRIADRNPFFLISAVCMLWGCLSLTNSSSWNSLPLPRLLLLIGTLNCYEAALIALGIILVRRGLLRDGKMLLILEALFLVDVAFLNAEVVTTNLHIGIAVNVLLLVLASVKLLAISRRLPDLLPPARLLFVLAQMLVLLALPCCFRMVDHGVLSPELFYAGWWVIGLMPLAGAAIRRSILTAGEGKSLRGLSGFFLVLPWISLIAHLGILHYAYNVEFVPAMAAPLLLGIAVGLTRIAPSKLLPQKEITGLQVLLPLLALCISNKTSASLIIHLFAKPSLAITPLYLAAAGAFLTITYCFFWRYAARLVVFGGMAATAVVFGPSVDQIKQSAWHGWNWSVDSTNWLIPKTATQWGIVSVIASFLFLVLGAAISLKRVPKSMTGS